jgi:type I restriction enzyme R subunit
MSNFTFLQAEWPQLHEWATRAESLANTDARAACFYARRTLELAVAWLYKHDRGLRLPYQGNLNALLHEPSFARVVGEAVFTKTKVIKELGNQAVPSTRKVLPADAQVATRELFHIAYWLARTYGQRGRPDPGLAFNAGLLARPAAAAPAVPPQTLDQLQKLETQLAERDERLTTLLGTTAALDAELARLREQVAAAKRVNAATPDTHDYSEAQTRDCFIDLLLKEAGRLVARCEDELRGRGHRHAGLDRAGARPGLRGLRAVGRRRPTAGAGGSQAHEEGRQAGPAAGQAVRRLLGTAIWPAAGDLLLQRL